jgi:hypothetical protein
VKFAMACAVLLALFPRGALAADGRHLTPSPSAPATTAATPESPASLPAVAANNAPATLPAAPAPATAAPASLNTALPSPPSAIITLKKPEQSHRFFDARNSFGLAALAAGLTADSLSTQKGLAYPGFHEMNPIARPFVQTRLGGAVYSGGSFALLAGSMYVAHRTRHHKLERILPFAVAGWEGLISARNYRVIATHR